MHEPIVRRVRAYPLALSLTSFGAILGITVALISGDLLSGALVLVLFLIVGHSWRHDMLPALPAVLAYQFFAMSIGYWFYVAYGYYPGGGDVESIETAVVFSGIALVCLLIGVRLGLRAFHRSFQLSLQSEVQQYSQTKLFWLTVIMFSANFVYDILPTQIWFGAAQIIANLLKLRFVPYFMLLVIGFEQRKGLKLIVAATAVVILPELLTGFSGFKEILLAVTLAALVQWRPWVRSRRQKAINRSVALIGAAFSLLALGAGLIWTGGLKLAWRSLIWRGDGAESSPTERLGEFFRLAGQSWSNFDLATTLETLAARFSSGTLYFANTLERVPLIVPHQDGRLLGLTIENLTPRVLNPNKAVLGGDSWIVREFAGLTVAGDESGASIGLGWPAEFYIDFGIVGVIGLSVLYGFIAAGCLALLSRAARNREIFFGLMVALLTSSLMSIDGSFIKLLPGLIQRTLIAVAVVVIVGPTILKIVRTSSDGQRTGLRSSRSAPN